MHTLPYCAASELVAFVDGVESPLPSSCSSSSSPLQQTYLLEENMIQNTPSQAKLYIHLPHVRGRTQAVPLLVQARVNNHMIQGAISHLRSLFPCLRKLGWTIIWYRVPSHIWEACWTIIWYRVPSHIWEACWTIIWYRVPSHIWEACWTSSSCSLSLPQSWPPRHTQTQWRRTLWIAHSVRIQVHK